jgi:SAM-dependent methyltransferase
LSGLSRFARQWLLPFFDPRQVAGVARLPGFFREWREYRTQAGEERIPWRDLYPCLSDRSSHTPFDPHYFFQGAWLARRLAQVQPTLHVDVGSSVMMVSVLSAQHPIVCVDYRPLRAALSGLTCVAATATRLPFSTGALESVSSLHVIEHVGLGRYGDPLDPSGSQAAAKELSRVVRPGGRLFVSVPVGRPRVCFNAHRVFDPRSIQAMTAGMRLQAFSLVDDDGRFTQDADICTAERQDYGCGMFEFIKPL